MPAKIAEKNTVLKLKNQSSCTRSTSTFTQNLKAVRKKQYKWSVAWTWPSHASLLRSSRHDPVSASDAEIAWRKKMRHLSVFWRHLRESSLRWRHLWVSAWNTENMFPWIHEKSHANCFGCPNNGKRSSYHSCLS